MENRNYILDTDIGPDCDDAAALALAVLYARRQRAKAAGRDPLHLQPMGRGSHPAHLEMVRRGGRGGHAEGRGLSQRAADGKVQPRSGAGGLARGARGRGRGGVAAPGARGAGGRLRGDGGHRPDAQSRSPAGLRRGRRFAADRARADRPEGSAADGHGRQFHARLRRAGMERGDGRRICAARWRHSGRARWSGAAGRSAKG